jgi:hypothetical protein
VNVECWCPWADGTPHRHTQECPTAPYTRRDAGLAADQPLRTYVIGVDPGRVTGIAGLSIFDGELTGHSLIQCSHDVPRWLVRHMLDACQPVDRLVLAVERFVVRARAGRSSDAAAGEITRALIGALASIGRDHGATVYLRSASDVKPWATDKRLEAAGLNKYSTMRHAADAARHALFAAVHDAGLPDPLSKRRKT